jgi:hypothetical protein
MGCCGSRPAPIAPAEDYSYSSDLSIFERIYDEISMTRRLVDDLLFGFEKWVFIPQQWDGEVGLPSPIHISSSGESVELLLD